MTLPKLIDRASSDNGKPLVIPDNETPSTALIVHRSFLRQCMGSVISEALNELVILYSDTDGFFNDMDTLDRRSRMAWSTVIVSTLGWADESESLCEVNRLSELSNSPPVVLLCEAPSEDFVRRAFAAGARGCIPTSLEISAWIWALRFVRAGGLFAPADHLQAEVQNLEAPAAHPVSEWDDPDKHTIAMAGQPIEIEQEERTKPVSLNQLDNAPEFTPREVSVLNALAQGQPNKIIAYQLKISESTVKVHVRNIMKKLSVKNRTEVALFASGSGLDYRPAM
ncbi:MAG: response regulator transcription factor [Pseudomonadota bacterium]